MSNSERRNKSNSITITIRNSNNTDNNYCGSHDDNGAITTSINVK